MVKLFSKLKLFKPNLGIEFQVFNFYKFFYYNIRGYRGFLEKFSISFSQKVFFFFIFRLTHLLKSNDHSICSAICPGFKNSSFFKNPNNEIFIFLLIFKRSISSLRLFYFSIFYILQISNNSKKLLFIFSILSLSLLFPIFIFLKLFACLFFQLFDLIFFFYSKISDQIKSTYSVKIWFKIQTAKNSIFYYYTIFRIFFFSFFYKIKNIKNFSEFKKKFSKYKETTMDVTFFSLIQFKAYANYYFARRHEKSRKSIWQFMKRYTKQLNSRLTINSFRDRLFRLMNKFKRTNKRNIKLNPYLLTNKNPKPTSSIRLFKLFFFYPFFFINSYFKQIKNLDSKLSYSYFKELNKNYFNLTTIKPFYLIFFKKFSIVNFRSFISFIVFFSPFKIFGLFSIEFNVTKQYNYFKLFMLLKPIKKFSNFFINFRQYSDFFQNDISFAIFSNPHLFNFFFPVFSNIFIDSIVQDSALNDSHRSLYSNPSLLEEDDDLDQTDDDNFENFESEPLETNDDNMTHPNNAFNKAEESSNSGYGKINNFESNNDEKETGEDEDEYDDLDDDEDSEREDYEYKFITDRWSRKNKRFSKNINYDLEHDAQLSANILIFYAEQIAEYDNTNGDGFIANSSSVEFPDLNVNELLYQHYFSRFYGSYNIDIFFYSFIFPYAFKNFSIGFKTSYIFRNFFFSFSDKIYIPYYSIFYISPILNFFSSYFKISSLTKIKFIENSFKSKTFKFFYIFRLFFKFKFLPIFKNFLYGYFKFVSTTNLQRDLEHYNTYSRLYDLKHGETDADSPTNNVAVDMIITEDEDENPEYINHFFLEHLDESNDDDLSDDLFETNSDDFNFEIYVYSDDFIEPFLTDDEFQKSVEYSISQDDSILDPVYYNDLEQIDFEISETSLSELLIQNAYATFLENLFASFYIINNKAFINQIDPVSDIDFVVNDDGPDFQDDLYDRSNQTQGMDEDLYREPINKKALVLIKNIAEIYNDRSTKWLIKNKNLNLKPLPPFLYGIGRYTPDVLPGQFFKLSNLQSLHSNPSYYKAINKRLSSFVYDYSFKNSKLHIDKNFLKNFFITFQAPIHLYPNDAHLSIVIVFHLLSKSFNLNFRDFIDEKNMNIRESYFLTLGGLLFQLFLISESNSVGIHETLNINDSEKPLDQEFEMDVIFTLRTFSPRILSAIRKKYSYFVYDILPPEGVNTSSNYRSKRVNHTRRSFIRKLKKLRQVYKPTQSNQFFDSRNVRVGFVQGVDVIQTYLENLHDVNPGLLYQYNKFSDAFFGFFRRYSFNFSNQNSRLRRYYPKHFSSRFYGVDSKRKKINKFGRFEISENDDQDWRYFHRENKLSQSFWLRKYDSLRFIYKPFIRKVRKKKNKGIFSMKKFIPKFPLFNLPYFKFKYKLNFSLKRSKKRIKKRMKRFEKSRLYRYHNQKKIKKNFRHVSRLYKFFKLDLTSVYDTKPYISKSTSFFELFYFINYSLFYAFYHLIEDFFFIYSLLQTSIPKKYRITPKIYQSFKWNLRAKNTYDIFNTYYSNYLFNIYPNKISQLKRFFSRKDLLEKFGYNPETYFYNRFKKHKLDQAKFNKKGRHIQADRVSLKRFHSKFHLTDSPVFTNYNFNDEYRSNNNINNDIDDDKIVKEISPSYYTDLQLLFVPRDSIATRLKFHDEFFYYKYNHTSNIPESNLFELDETEFFYTNGDNPFHSFLFNTNTFSFFRTFDFYLQPYQYTFPIGTYFFDNYFYPEDEANTDFSIFDFYILSDQDELLDDNERDPSAFDTDTSENENDEDLYDAKDFNVQFDSADHFTTFDNISEETRETSDGTNDLETSEYALDDQDLEFGDLDSDLEADFIDEYTDQGAFDLLFGYSDDYDEENDAETSEALDDEYDLSIEDSFLSEENSFSDNLFFDTDYIYEDEFEDFGFSADNPDFSTDLTYHSTFYRYDKSFSDPFLFSNFYKYQINPKHIYPASTFLHYAPLRNLYNSSLPLNLKIRDNYKNRYANSTKFRLKLVKTKNKNKHRLKFRNSKYYRRYLHFSTLLNKNQPFYTASFPLYNFYQSDFQFLSEDTDPIDVWGSESEHEAEIISFSSRSDDFRIFLDQENDDLDPDFFDFSLYTSIPISRFFFGYAKSRAYPFVVSDPRFVTSGKFEFKFLNHSTFSSSFASSSTALVNSQENTYSPTSKSFLHPFVRFLIINFVKFFLTFRLFFVYSFIYNKPELLLSETYELLFNHHYKHQEQYSVSFFSKYYVFLKVWNSNLKAFTLSSLKFDYFKNFFNPIFYSSTKFNKSPYNASKFSSEPDSEYLHLDFFLETHLYTSVLANEKIEKIIKDRIKMPVFFWNYEEYFLHIINNLDEYEFYWNADTSHSMLLPSTQNFNIESSDESVELTDVYEELFDNLKNVYVSRIEIFLDALGQLFFIWFFSLFSLFKLSFFKTKTFFSSVRIYNELNWIQLYVKYGPMVNIFRTFMAFSIFSFFIFYSFFNLPYFIFYFYPFLSTFSFLIINSVFLGLVFFFSAYICFKNFRFFVASLDEYERFGLFTFGFFFWFYNVYLGYLKNSAVFVSFDPGTVYMESQPYYFMLLERTDEAARQRNYYRRTQYFPHTLQSTTDPMFRYSDSKSLATGPALNINSYESTVFRDKVRDFYPGYLQPNRFREIGKYTVQYPFNYSNIIQSFSNPSKNSVRLISPNSLPNSAHSVYTNRLRKVGNFQRRVKLQLAFPFSNSNPLLESNFFPNPIPFFPINIYDPMYIKSVPVLSTLYSGDRFVENTYRDYIYYPYSVRLRPSINNRHLRRYRAYQFRSLVSYRSGIPKRTITIHDDPLFRQFINKPNWYSPSSWYKTKPKYFNPIANYFRSSYFRTMFGRYYRGSARGAARYLTKRFQKDPIKRSKQVKRKIFGNSRRFYHPRRYEVPYTTQTFSRDNPYIYTGITDETLQQFNPRSLYRYTPFENTISTTNQFSSIFSFYQSRQSILPKSFSRNRASVGSHSLNRAAKKYVSFRRTQRVSSQNNIYPVSSDSFSDSAIKIDLEKRISSSFYFSKQLPTFFLYYKMNQFQISSNNFPIYQRQIRKRFKFLSERKIPESFNFKELPPHYKFNAFISKNFNQTFNFFNSKSLVNRSAFNFSTLFNKSIFGTNSANNLVRIIRYKKHANLFKKFLHNHFVNLKSESKKTLYSAVVNLDQELLSSKLQNTAFRNFILSVTNDQIIHPPILSEYDPLAFNNFNYSTKSKVLYPEFYSYLPNSIYQVGFSKASQNSFFASLNNSVTPYYYPLTLAKFNVFFINEQKTISNYNKRLRDMIVFRYWFLKSVNERKRFLYNFTSANSLPIYSTSNYLSQLIFNFHNFSFFDFKNNLDYPVLEPYFFSAIYPIPNKPVIQRRRKPKLIKPISDRFAIPLERVKPIQIIRPRQPFGRIFDSYGSQLIPFFNTRPFSHLDFVAYQNSFKFDSTKYVRIRKFYSPSNYSFNRFQNNLLRLRTRRYRPDVSKIFDRHSQRIFSILHRDYAEMIFSSSTFKKLPKKDAQTVGRARLKYETLFSKRYHRALLRRRNFLLAKHKRNRKHRFTISEKIFLKNKLNKKSSLDRFSQIFLLENSLFVKSAFSNRIRIKNFKIYGFYGSKSLNIKLTKFSSSGYPFSTRTTLSTDLKKQRDIFPSKFKRHRQKLKKLEPRFASLFSPHASNYTRRQKNVRTPTFMPKIRPSAYQNSIFKSVKNKRPAYHYRSYYFISKYVNIL